MARKLHYDRANKRTFMRENVMGNTITGVRVCAACKKQRKTLYKYWFEPDIGGSDTAPRYAVPFCSIDCYREYFDEPLLQSLKQNLVGS